MIVLTVNYGNDKTLQEHNIFYFDHAKHSIKPGMIVMWVFSAISLVFLLLDVNLVFFHIFLIRKKLTTFQYITLIQERKENERELVISRFIKMKLFLEIC